MVGSFPTTPDGRYFVVNARLWRRANPNLPVELRQALVLELMNARRQLSKKTLGNNERLAARARVDAAKRALGERGDVWWDDGAPDFNRRMVKNTPYAAWFEALAEG